MVLENTLESPSYSKEIKPVHPKGNQSWIFIGRTESKAETPILWPPDLKNWFIRKDPDAGKDWRQEEKGMTEDEMVGWHHWLSGHEFEQSPGVGDGQGSLACCSPCGCKVSDMTEQLIWTELRHLNNRKSSNSGTWDVAPFICIAYFFQEHFVVFSMQAFGHVKQLNSQQVHNLNGGTNRPERGLFERSCQRWNKQAENCLVWPQMGPCASGDSKVFPPLHMSKNDWESAMDVQWMLIWVINKFH